MLAASHEHVGVSKKKQKEKIGKQAQMQDVSATDQCPSSIRIRIGVIAPIPLPPK
jgi:hypothetical protein